MHTYYAEKWNKSLLFVSDITGSEMKKESTHLLHQWRHWCFASCEHDRGLFTRQASFVGKSWRQAHISSNLDDQGVICLLGGCLFCQKMVAIYHYSPHVILIDSSTEITSLELNVSSVKLCRAKRCFKVHFFRDNKLKFAYFWLTINFVCFSMYTYVIFF